ncbi:MAG: tetratricopeptide repeat protein [Candidatus Tectimicrobiota bacterium]
MSIINQALQKAQREQLLQRPYDMPYLSAGQRRRTARRRWRLVLSCVVVLGLGAAGGRWLLQWSADPAGAPEPPAPAQLTFVESTLREAARAQSVPLEAGAPPAAAPEPPPDEALARQVSTPPPLLVLAVETSSLPLPRVAPIPLPASAVPPPVSEPDAPADAVPEVPSSSAIARGQLLVQRALEAQNSGELKRAATLLEQAVKLDPTAKAAYNSLGNVYFQQKRFQQAVQVYHKALALDPDYAKARNNLGSTYMQLAMYEQAIEELQRALRSADGASLAYYNLACVYARKGDSVTAAEYLRQAILLEPQARTWARTDADFARVRDTLVVQQLLEP